MAEFQKDSPGWQLETWGRRIKEWWELETSKIDIPKFDIPRIPWFDEVTWQFILDVLFWLIVTSLVIWIVLRLIPIIIRMYYKLSKSRENDEIKTSKDFNTILTVDSWLKKSNEYQSMGNYREACVCLYKAMLQKLNDQGIAKHQLSRTDGEYLQLLLKQPQIQLQYYQKLLSIHQDLCFGEKEASMLLVEECKKAYEKI